MWFCRYGEVHNGFVPLLLCLTAAPVPLMLLFPLDPAQIPNKAPESGRDDPSALDPAHTRSFLEYPQRISASFSSQSSKGSEDVSRPPSEAGAGNFESTLSFNTVEMLQTVEAWLLLWCGAQVIGGGNMLVVPGTCYGSRD